MSSVGSSNTPLRSAPASLSTEQWVHLLPVGHVQGRDGRGPYIIDDPDAVILRTQERAGNTQLPIDYEHQTIVTAKNGQPAPAAGWIKGLQARADGIWGLAAWTDRASGFLKSREYRYISPVFSHTKDGVVICILSAALTNTPNLELTALARQETKMDMTLEEFMAKMRDVLGMPPDSDQTSIIQAVSDLLVANHSANADLAKFVPLGEFQRVVGEYNKLNQGVSMQTARDHVESNIRFGNLPPFLHEWGVSLCAVNKPAFDSFLKNTRSIFDFGRSQGGGPAFNQTSAHRTTAELDDVEADVCARLRLTPEELAKAKRFEATISE